MRRWTQRLAVVSMATFAVAAAGQVSAYAACPVSDLTCQLGEAAGAGDGVLGDGPVDTPVDETIDPVVDPVVDDVLDRVRDVIGESPIDIPDPIGGGGGGGGHVGGPPANGGPRGTPTAGDRSGRGNAVLRNLDGPGISSLPGTTISATSGVAPSDTQDRTGNRFGSVLEGVARGSVVLLVLFGLAVAFVTIQDRLDRQDPRLALAPVGSDVVEFA
jgi:hypothetical protein